MKVKFPLAIVVVLFAAGLLFPGSGEARLDPQTILGMWLFDDDGGDVASDLSGNGNDASLKNGPRWDDGKFGSALEFNGTNYVDCGNSETLDVDEEITVAAWVNFSAVDYKNSGGGLFTIAAKGKPDALTPHAGWWFSHDNRNNGQSFNYTCFGNENGGWSGGGNNFSGRNFQFSKGEWYHIAFTVGDSIGRLYINGIQQGTDKTFVDLVLPNAGTNLTIGAGTGSIYPFNGLIDEVVLLNVAADEEDIQEIMNEGLERASGVIAVEFSGKLTTTWAGIK